MLEQDYIEFEAYLSGTLDAKAVEAFKDRLQSDADFKVAFEDYKEATLFLNHKIKNEAQSVDFKENLEQIGSNYFNKTGGSEVKIKRIKPWFYSVAAAVILLFGVVIAQQFSNPTYDDFANYGTLSLTVRGEENKVQHKAEKAFNQKDYRNAEKYLSELLQKDSENLELQLYRAVSLVELNAYKTADIMLHDIIESTSVYSNKARWYLALSKLKQNNKVASIEVLKSIPGDAEDYENAKKLLNKLQ